MFSIVRILPDGVTPHLTLIDDLERCLPHPDRISATRRILICMGPPLLSEPIVPYGPRFLNGIPCECSDWQGDLMEGLEDGPGPEGEIKYTFYWERNQDVQVTMPERERCY